MAESACKRFQLYCQQTDFSDNYQKAYLLFEFLLGNRAFSINEKCQGLMNPVGGITPLCALVVEFDTIYPGTLIRYVNFLLHAFTAGIPANTIFNLLAVENKSGLSLGHHLFHIKDIDTRYFNVWQYFKFLDLLVREDFPVKYLWSLLILTDPANKIFGCKINAGFLGTLYNKELHNKLQQLMQAMAKDKYDTRLIELLNEAMVTGYTVPTLIKKYHNDEIELIFKLIERGYLPYKQLQALSDYKEAIRDYLFQRPEFGPEEIQDKAKLLLRSIDKFDPLGQFFYIQRNKNCLFGKPADLTRGTLKQLYDYQKEFHRDYHAFGHTPSKLTLLDVDDGLAKDYYTCLSGPMNKALASIGEMDWNVCGFDSAEWKRNDR